MQIYVPYKYSEAINALTRPAIKYNRISLEQATRIKAIMDRTAQELKKVTGRNPEGLIADVDGIIFVKRYAPEQQIMVENGNK